MKTVRVLNKTQGGVLGGDIGLADRWWQRLRGLLGRPPLTEGQGMLLTPCQAVHTFGMRTPLDVVFLNRRGVVVGLYAPLAPGRRTRRVRRATHVLELPPGTIERTGTRLEDLIAWQPSDVTTGAQEGQCPNGEQPLLHLRPRKSRVPTIQDW